MRKQIRTLPSSFRLSFPNGSITEGSDASKKEYAEDVIHYLSVIVTRLSSLRLGLLVWQPGPNTLPISSGIRKDSSISSNCLSIGYLRECGVYQKSGLSGRFYMQALKHFFALSSDHLFIHFRRRRNGREPKRGRSYWTPEPVICQG